jgi:ABC-type multidrug transport system permease subunit
LNKKYLRSVGAVLAGLVTIVVLSNGTDTILETTGVFPPLAVQQEQGFDTTWMVALALAYRAIYMVAGGYATAALAPNGPVLHAVVLGVVGIVLGVLGAVATWGIAPAWFNVLLIVLGPPCAWLGAKLRIGQSLDRGRNRRTA